MNDDATPTAPAAGVVSRSGSGDRVDPVDPVDLVDAVALLAAGEAAALGGAPGDAEASLRPLVHSSGPFAARARWLLAVAAGAQGRYTDALGSLRPLIEDDAVLPVLRAAACATSASLLRQIGDHPSAEPFDARGVALLTDRPPGVGVDEALDCAVGLTADAVGTGDLVDARRRLDDARGLAVAGGPVPPGWRPLVRLRWVEAEVALLAGDVATAAVAGTAAHVLATAAGAIRHRTKSAMFAGVALALAEGPDAARGLLLDAARDADSHGLLPLVWPLRAVLATMPGLAADELAAQQHLDVARAAVVRIAAGLPEVRVRIWTARDPMAAYLLGSDAQP
jgi:hypothetical protein